MTWGAKTFVYCIIFGCAYIIIKLGNGSFFDHSHSYANRRHHHASNQISDFEKRVKEEIEKYVLKRNVP